MPFVKGVVPFLKGDGQLVKGADRLKLLSKLAVFPLLLIFATFAKICRIFAKFRPNIGQIFSGFFQNAAFFETVR